MFVAGEGLAGLRKGNSANGLSLGLSRGDMAERRWLGRESALYPEARLSFRAEPAATQGWHGMYP